LNKNKAHLAPTAGFRQHGPILAPAIAKGFLTIMQHVAKTTSESCLQLKGSLVPMTVMELFQYDQLKIETELARIISQAPGFFEDTPVIIALERFPENDAEIDFDSLLRICKLLNIKPVAVRGGSMLQQLAARQSGLATLPPTKSRGESKETLLAATKATLPSSTDASDTHLHAATTSLAADGAVQSLSESPLQNTAAARPVETEAAIEAANEPDSDIASSTAATDRSDKLESIPTKIIYQPVRSGQQIYAKGGDLIILAAVSPGAEILADGNIHVYGALRGRALAGVRGDTRARIFCHSLEAELVSIAGHYKISEDLQKSGWKTASQIGLIEDKLTITPLIK
jgi:septum site-determining protein MinC